MDESHRSTIVRHATLDSLGIVKTDGGMAAMPKRKSEYDAAGMFPSSAKPIPLQYVIKNLEERIHKDELYSDMILYWPFLACFVVFFLAGRAIAENHMAASAVRAMYLTEPYSSSASNAAEAIALPPDAVPYILEDRMFLSIRRASDWHKWFRDVLVPFTWDCEQPGYSRQTLFKRGQMQYLGAMKLRVMLMRDDSCDFNEGFRNTSSTVATPCWSKHKQSREDKLSRCGKLNPANGLETLWSYTEADDVVGGVYTTGSRGVYHPGGFTATIPFNATCDMVNDLSQTILSASDPDCNIIDDRRTRLVIVEWFQYAANTDTFLTAKLFLEIDQVGGWVPNYQFRMFPVWTSKRIWNSVFDIFFFIFVLYFLVRLLSDWMVFYQRNKKLLAFCFNLWNVMEITNIATFLAVLILRWIWWSKSQKTDISFPFAPAYPQDLDRLALLFSAQIYANSVNVVITVIKALKYVRLNNRLNVLTRTLHVAQQSVAGVLLLFLFVLAGYAVCATTLYGSNLLRFRNLNTSFSSLMFLLLGQGDYERMRAQQPLLTGAFYFSFVVLANFLLLNFIIAILSEGFSQVSGETALEPLDRAILRQLTMLRYHLDPRNLKKVFELRLKKRTRTELLVEVVTYLKEHMELIELHAPELLDSELPMYKSDLRQWLPEHLNQDLGDYYADLLWDDMEHDHKINSASENYQQKQEIEEIVLRGVGNVVQNRLQEVDKMEESSARLERIVDRISQLANEVFQ